MILRRKLYRSFLWLYVSHDIHKCLKHIFHINTSYTLVPLIFFLHLFHTCAFRPNLFVSAITSSHCAFLGGRVDTLRSAYTNHLSLGLTSQITQWTKLPTLQFIHWLLWEWTMSFQHQYQYHTMAHISKCIAINCKQSKTVRTNTNHEALSAIRQKYGIDQSFLVFHRQHRMLHST